MVITMVLAGLVAVTLVAPASASKLVSQVKVAHKSGPHHDSGPDKGQANASLALTVVGLPSDLGARITIVGPGFKSTATKSQVFQKLKPGTYTVSAQPAVFKHSIAGVREGSTAYPNEKTFTVVVKSSQKSKASVTYGNIIDSRVSLLTTAVTAVVAGDADDPKRISLPKDRKFSVGQILTQAPSAVLPAGLFHRIISVSGHGSTVTLTLVPAHLAEAFPQIDIDSHLTFTTPTVAKVSSSARTVQAAAAPLDAVNASLGMDNFRCQIPVSDSSLTVTETVSVGLDVAFNVPKRFGIPVGPPTGHISATLGASASLALLLRKNLGCTASVNSPPLQGAIPVGPVVIPVYARVGVSGSLTVGQGDLITNGSVGASITSGVAFTGTKISILSGLSGNASASVAGAGKFAAGPTIKFAVGVADAADIHLDVNPQLSVTGATDGTCEVAAALATQFGVAFGPFQLNQPLPDLKKVLYRCTATPPSSTTLAIQHQAPLGAFPNQSFGYTVKVTNTGSATATGVTVTEVLPAEGAFVSSSPAGTPAAPANGASYTIPLGTLAAGQSASAVVTWRAPTSAATLTASASASSGNAPTVGPVAASVPVGTAVRCNPCGATSAGTGLRNRDHGAVTISAVPSGATVGRAVLVWGVLYSGAQPANAITFQGKTVTADVTSSVSGNLCWGDTNTVGYAADVTSLVTGNGTYEITEPVRGITRVDNNPTATLPYTDGATLLVFYNGGGANNQVLSDFTYDTNTDADQAIDRTFSGINSLGKAANLTLAGPDGQTNYGEVFTLTGSGVITLTDSWNGSDPQDGPSFPIGNLWDTDVHDVSSILPAGQSTFTFHNTKTSDCDGVGAAVLQIAQ